MATTQTISTRRTIRTCVGCGAVSRGDAWAWSEDHESSERAVCPACVRVQSREAAGEVLLDRDTLNVNESEVVHFVHNVGMCGVLADPLRRIIAIEQEDGLLVVKTTERDLAREIAAAVVQNYGGGLCESQAPEGYLRIRWLAPKPSGETMGR